MNWHNVSDPIISQRCVTELNTWITLHKCPTGSVINIQSADTGYSLRISCGLVNHCEVTNQTEIVRGLCNGQRQCSFPHNFLHYAQCSPEYRYRKFISVSYNCAKSKRRELCMSVCCVIVCKLCWYSQYYKYIRNTL